jgi:hypothetical protein
MMNHNAISGKASQEYAGFKLVELQIMISASVMGGNPSGEGSSCPRSGRWDDRAAASCYPQEMGV